MQKNKIFYKMPRFLLNFFIFYWILIKKLLLYFHKHVSNALQFKPMLALPLSK